MRAAGFRTEKHGAILSKIDPLDLGWRDPTAFARAFLADAGLEWAADLLADFSHPQAPPEGDK